MLNKIYEILSRHLPSNALRIACQRARGVKVGRNVYLGYETILDPACPQLIELEDDTRIGIRVIILAHNRPGDCWLDHLGEQQAAVRIKRYAAVYAGAIIMPGVTVGEGAIVHAGAVVEEDVPPFSVVAGVPARVVEQLPQAKLQERG